MFWGLEKSIHRRGGRILQTFHKRCGTDFGATQSIAQGTSNETDKLDCGVRSHGYFAVQRGPWRRHIFIGPRNKIKGHASTVPSNGDVNPYGVAVVPQESGDLHQGHVLVSNFNNSMNFQGTGTTIVEISPGDGSTKLFAHIDATKLPG